MGEVVRLADYRQTKTPRPTPASPALTFMAELFSAYAVFWITFLYMRED